MYMMLISNAFNKAGFVEKFGTGIPKILGACEEKGNPAPFFEIASDGMDFSVTFRPSKLYCALDSYRNVGNAFKRNNDRE